MGIAIVVFVFIIVLLCLVSILPGAGLFLAMLSLTVIALAAIVCR